MPRDSALFTLLRSIAVCLHTVRLHVVMLWLTMIMQKPAIARRTVAIELFRRLDQMRGDKRAHADDELPPHSTDVMSEDKQSMPNGFGWRSRRPRTLEAKTCVSASKNGCTEVSITTRRAATANNFDSLQGTRASKLAIHKVRALDTKQGVTSTSSVQACTSRGVWTSATSVDTRDLTTLRRRAEEHARKADVAGAEPTPPPSPPETVDEGHYGTPWRYRRFDSSCTPLLADSNSSPISATEEFPFSRSSGQRTIRTDDEAVDGAQDDPFNSPNRILTKLRDEMVCTIAEPHHPQHGRTQSAHSISAPARIPSVSLAARSRTNGGLLELKANATRQTNLEPSCAHRPNVALNLPIRPYATHPEAIHLAPSDTHVSNTPATTYILDSWPSERELEYKHRHIFIGTASLHHFLDVLETTPTPTHTSRPAVTKAFTLLASKEQILARQASATTADWNLVTRITPDIASFDHVTLARVQLGAVSLQQFVDLVPFDAKDEVPTEVVVEAFKTASHLDAQAGVGARSKARAFRRGVLVRSEVE